MLFFFFYFLLLLSLLFYFLKIFLVIFLLLKWRLACISIGDYWGGIQFLSWRVFLFFLDSVQYALKEHDLIASHFQNTERYVELELFIGPFSIS